MLKNKIADLIEKITLIFAQIFTGYLLLSCLFFCTYIQFGKDGLYTYEFPVISRQPYW